MPADSRSEIGPDAAKYCAVSSETKRRPPDWSCFFPGSLVMQSDSGSDVQTVYRIRKGGSMPLLVNGGEEETLKEAYIKGCLGEKCVRRPW